MQSLLMKLFGVLRLLALILALDLILPDWA